MSRKFKPRIELTIATADVIGETTIKAPHVTPAMYEAAGRLQAVMLGADLDPFAEGWRACAAAFGIDADLSEERLKIEESTP